MNRKTIVLVPAAVIAACLTWAGCYLEVNQKGDNKCEGGDCCDENGFLRSSQFMCHEEEINEFRCSEDFSCGATVQKKWNVTYCTGNGTDCNGTMEEDWRYDHTCDNQSCDAGQCFCKNECCQQFHACSGDQTYCEKIGAIWVVQEGNFQQNRGEAVAAKNDDSFVVAGFVSVSGQATETFLAKYLSTGAFDWVKQTGGTADDQAKAVGWTSDQNVILAGSFGDSVLFESGANITLVSGGAEDAFIARFNTTNRNFDWAIQAGGPGKQEAMDLVVSQADDSVLVTGNFDGEITFPAGTDFIITPLGGLQDMFLARYDSAGTFDWALHAGSVNSGDKISTYAVVLEGNFALVVGGFMGTARFYHDVSKSGFDTIVSNSGELDIFIAKYRTNGTLDKVVRVGGTQTDNGYGAAALPNGDFLVCGEIYQTAEFPNDTGSIWTGPGTPNSQFFLAYLNADLNTQWVKFGSGNGYASGRAVAVTPASPSYIVLTGDFTSEAVFEKGQDSEMSFTSWGYNDVFVARYDLTGQFLWASQAGGSQAETPYGMSVLTDGNTIITGEFEGNWSFDNISISANADKDIFIMRAK